MGAGDDTLRLVVVLSWYQPNDIGAEPKPSDAGADAQSGENRKERRGIARVQRAYDDNGEKKSRNHPTGRSGYSKREAMA